MRKIITIIVGIIMVCGIGGFVIISSNKESEVNKLVASNKISPEEESLKNVKTDSEKNINTNINVFPIIFLPMQSHPLYMYWFLFNCTYKLYLVYPKNKNL